MPHKQQLARATAVFRALSVPVRIRIVQQLATHGEVYQKQLLHATGASQPAISRHLAYLARAGVLVKRREGRFMFWRLNRLPEDVRTLLSALAEGGFSSKADTSSVSAYQQAAAR